VGFPVRRQKSLFGKKNSLFSQEKGIGRKLLNPLGDRLRKPRKEARIVRNFQKFPAIFPDLRECQELRGSRPIQPPRIAE
jgi:hypothetical protein